MDKKKSKSKNASQQPKPERKRPLPTTVQSNTQLAAQELEDAQLLRVGFGATKQIANLWTRRAGLIGFALTALGLAVLYRSALRELLWSAWSWDSLALVLVVLGAAFLIVPGILFYEVFSPSEKKRKFSFRHLNVRWEADLQHFDQKLEDLRGSLPEAARKLLSQRFKEVAEERAKGGIAVDTGSGLGVEEEVKMTAAAGKQAAEEKEEEEHEQQEEGEGQKKRRWWLCCRRSGRKGKKEKKEKQQQQQQPQKERKDRKKDKKPQKKKEKVPKALPRDVWRPSPLDKWGTEERLLEYLKAELAAGATPAKLWREFNRPRAYVCDFDGDTVAGEVSQLRDFVSMVIAVAAPGFDEVVIKITSPGGTVHNYGFAGSQMARLREAGLRTTVCVDTVAASGGYMMACVADKIVASPFAIVGSIGVVAGVPNLSKVLKKNDVDYHLFTAGQYKRTVTMWTDVTPEAKKKFQEELTDVHFAFKQHVQRYRPKLDVDEIATGEWWLGEQAMEKGLVDELATSDAYVQRLLRTHEVFEIVPRKSKSSLLSSVGDWVSGLVYRACHALGAGLAAGLSGRLVPAGSAPHLPSALASSPASAMAQLASPLLPSASLAGAMEGPAGYGYGYGRMASSSWQGDDEADG